MVGTEVAGITVDLAVKALVSATPKGLEWVSQWAVARKLLVMGPQGSGKTCFVDYLRFGTLEPERPTAPTFDIQRIRKLQSLEFISSSKSKLKLQVKSVTDTPGHLPAEKQAILASDYAPHILLLITDLTLSDILKWLKSFLKTYRSRLMRKKKARNRLECICVAMNKFDKETKTRTIMREKQFRNTVDRELNDVFDPSFINDIPILPCVAVSTKLGTSQIDQVIFSIAKRVEKRG
jgi:GTPase SAR1 family protein